MSRIKLCGLRRACDIEYANELKPEYVGFVFARDSRRYVSSEHAELLRKELDSGIVPVGVFVDEDPGRIAALLKRNVIAAVQLHGSEDEEYINILRSLTDCSIIKAFRIGSEADIAAAGRCTADFVLLDSGGGTGKSFDHSLIANMHRNYFLAGGLGPDNVGEAVRTLAPYGVDASSGLETDGCKDRDKMTAFVRAVREA
ncbi:MAG: phosphoribosylanthranilate isomerase [Bacillota bacterium]|nr:phosphoribosylanthranilate isomerase [Bacillota bacterium]